MSRQADTITTARIGLPAGMTNADKPYPVVLVDTGQADLQKVEGDALDRINDALAEAMQAVYPEPCGSAVLLKVHIGEPRCTTRMRPEFARAASAFVSRTPSARIVAGDTTVAYTGDRGHQQNPRGKVRAYLALAEAHGWRRDGPAGMPFVVLDRPSTSVPDAFMFENEAIRVEQEGLERYRDFHLSGGFAAADFTINYAHLTCHGLAGFAGCVKSIAMGCSSLKGKLRMHQSLLPFFDESRCVGCGLCVENCPVEALHVPDDGKLPEAIRGVCIGCGECVAVCPNDAVVLRDEEITDWQRGRNTLPVRMADYTVGMMCGRWNRAVHVLHLYSITRQCDCVNIRQEPFLARDFGFLVGRNPFALDAVAADLLGEHIAEKQSWAARAAHETAQYVQARYNIHCRPPLLHQRVS